MRIFNFRKTNQKHIDVAKNLANNKLVNYARLDKDQLFSEFSTSERGLNQEQYEKSLDEYGLNSIKYKNEFVIFKRIIASFFNPFSIVLIILAIVSFITDYLLASTDKDFTAAVIILSLVTVSGIVRYVQETKSNKASESLRNLIKTTATVIRNQETFECPIEELVPGDIITLSAGDMIPADVRILAAKDLFIRQSSMTGESEPVEKFVNNLNPESNNALELSNLAFMGTNVISGSATAIILSTGNETLLGAMAKTLTEERGQTNFDKGVRSVSIVLIRFMAIMVPIVFLINGFTKEDGWIDALLFAISIAVGLTPEMLPMIVTSNLAKGAVFMSKKKVIVKNLNAIQNFGSMDVLCTDKTGTLTEDRIILERHLNIHGEEDLRVLRHGYLNSHFQTGLKNLMDVAIIQFGTEQGLNSLNNQYEKIDEIPFDFSRRRMSVLLKDKNNKTQLITKGAVEEIIDICRHAECKGEIISLTEDVKKEIFETVDSLNDKGMRVIAIAQKTNPTKVGTFTIEDEDDMVLLGYIGFLDPAKKSSRKALSALAEYGVTVKVLTGDNDKVTKAVAREVGLQSKGVVLGSDIENITDEELSVIVENNNIFAKLSPMQKARIVTALQKNNHVVGFMGDGINDAPALRSADVGISVDTAVDIAKEAADIILLEKDLMVLENGVIEGRKIFGNIIKYIKMTASSNFGNVLSVLAACAFLPFLPMLPIQILALNLIYDISCIVIPWDNVDEKFLRKPRRWDARSINKFMLILGPVSSIFDIITYLVLFFIVCPMVSGLGPWSSLTAEQRLIFAAVFHAGWFMESLITQTLVIHMIRTERIPFIQSTASKPVLIASITVFGLSLLIPYTGISATLKMKTPPPIYLLFVALILIGYMILVNVVKMLYIKKYKELL